MKIKRIMIAAPRSGSGKTTITCALLGALKNAGYRVSAYKCGPDYIDSMFHEKVTGVPAKNLDTFFTDAETTRKLFLDGARESDLAVLEGVMGLYDGLGGVREEGSAYHLAQVTKTPIILVVDAKGMGRSLIPLIAGFLDYDRERLIQGVLLNRISGGFYETIKPRIEEALKIRVIGFLPEKEEYHIGSRHLGLMMPHELQDMRQKLQTVSDTFAQNVSLDSIMEIAENAEEIETDEKATLKEAVRHVSRYSGIISNTAEIEKSETITKTDSNVIIAVAKDEAFCFYYADNIRLLEAYGAEIKYFSPLRDEKLPDGCHALLLGGGYPELYAGALSRNADMRHAVKWAADNGMPIVAECGGFMYLHSALTDREGVRHDMADVIPAVCFDAGKKVRFGYVEIQEKQPHFLPEGGKIKGHEFHYYDSTDNGRDAVARKPTTEKAYPCIMADENHFMGFPHLYYPSNPAFAATFVEKARKYKKKATQQKVVEESRISE